MKKPCRSEGVNQEYLGRAGFLAGVRPWTRKENSNSSNDRLHVFCKYDAQYSLFDLVSALSVTLTAKSLPVNWPARRAEAKLSLGDKIKVR